MNWRFRRSVKICKGLKLNFSNSGISYTTGFKGYTITHTKNGNYRNISIPILGIHSREKISDKKTVKKINHVSLDTKVVMSMNEKKEVVFKDMDGNIIVDKDYIRMIKRTPAYESEKKRLDSDMTLHNLLVLNDWEKENNDYFKVHKHAQKVLTQDDYFNQLKSLKPDRYIRRTFDKVPPSESSIRAVLENEAEQYVTTYAFWKLKRLREQYVEDRLSAEYNKQLAQYNTEKDAFEQNQNQIEAETNALFQIEYEEKISYFTKLATGDEEILTNEIDSWIADVTLPYEIHINYDYIMNSGIIMMDLDLPEIEDIPDTELKISERGILTEKKKSRDKLENDYRDLVYGLGLFLVSNIFNISPHVQGILLSAFTQRKDKKGEIKDTYIYSIKFSRHPFEENDIANQFSAFFFCVRNFENRIESNMQGILPFASFEE